MEKNRIKWLDSLKGIAILLVVLRHIMQANVVDSSSVLLGNMIYAIQMPLFVTIAGYFSVTRADYYSSIKSVKSYIGKRALHLMVPFFSWYIIAYVLIRGYYSRNIGHALVELIFNVDIGLWFLYVVFVLSVLLILAKWLVGKITKSNEGGVVSLILICLYYDDSSFADRKSD